MAAESELEKELTKRAKLDDPEAKTLKKSFDSLKDHLVKNHYPWVQATCNWFTDHGELHVAAVMHSASELVKLKLSGKKANALSTLEVYLILTAILWHDVGMVIDRATHAELVYDLTDNLSDFFPNPTVQGLVAQIANAHKGKDSLDKLPTHELCTIEGPGQEVNPALLAAIVRFADEISENHTRVSGSFLNVVPDPQKIFWMYALSVGTCVAQPDRERIIIDFKFDADHVLSRWPDMEFPEFRCPNDQKIHLLTYALCRLEKINNEREYCFRYFSSVAPIRDIEARFSISKAGRKVEGYENFSTQISGGAVSSRGYPSIKIVKEFFDRHPDWKIEAIEGAIK